MNTSLNKRIAVFCGSSAGTNPCYRESAIELARVMHYNELGLVYGGGNIGLMGILADELIKLGGKVIGVIPKKLVDIELAHTGLTQLYIVASMHERKALMAKLSDAFIALPGGIGTLEEFFEVFTWLQLGYHNKPVGLLNTNNFYDLLYGFLQQLEQQGFVIKSHLDKLIIKRNSKDLIDAILLL